MSPNNEFVSPAEASRRLGVSIKALRHYEERGLIAPIRTEAGWRAYGPNDLARADQIVALRGLGLSIGQITRVLDGDANELDCALAAHQTSLKREISKLSGGLNQIQEMRKELAAGQTTKATDLIASIGAKEKSGLALDLPWPWGGERFETKSIQPLTFITGPLGSGKTRLAKRIADTLPDATYLGLDRFSSSTQATGNEKSADADHAPIVDEAVSWLLDEGATYSESLRNLLAQWHEQLATVLIIDMPEQQLDETTQKAVMAYIRRRPADAKPLFLLTRSTAILDLELVGHDETIIYCPANHSPPMIVQPIDGAPGYEALVTCLAAPMVRARTEGVIAMRKQQC